MDWYKKVVFGNYANSKGRARRKEYWMFVLINVIISIVLAIIDGLIGSDVGILGGIYSLAVLIPSLAVAVRRLHDTERSGWWLLIAIIPVIGWILLIVWLATDGKPGDNQYGSNPKGITAAPVEATPAQ